MRRTCWTISNEFGHPRLIHTVTHTQSHTLRKSIVFTLMINETNTNHRRRNNINMHLHVDSRFDRWSVVRMIVNKKESVCFCLVVKLWTDWFEIVRFQKTDCEFNERGIYVDLLLIPPIVLNSGQEQTDKKVEAVPRFEYILFWRQRNIHFSFLFGIQKSGRILIIQNMYNIREVYHC